VIPLITQVEQLNPSTQNITVVPIVTTQEVKRIGESYVDSIFMAVSALCVTGLSSTDFSQYTLAGQIILMILIQI
jgi:Trk-type K+ transport system membrane component